MKKILFCSLLSSLLFSKEFDHDLHFPKCDFTTLKKESYTLCYDLENKRPQFISYNTMDFFQDEELIKTKYKLVEDESIDEDYRIKPEFYINLDNFLPTKLIPTSSAYYSEKGKKDSYLLSNTIPMSDSTFALWKQIDKLETTYLDKYKDIFIVSGVTYKGKKATTDLSIPNAYYKIFYVPSKSKMIGFFIPYQDNYPLTNIFQYQETISYIEKQTGIKFYPSLQEDVSIKMKSIKADF